MQGLHPWWPFTVHPHFLFESLAYVVAFRVFTRDRARGDVVGDPFTRAVLLTVAVLGAVVGAKALCWLEDPASTWARRGDPVFLLGGKSIVGALLGGWVAVEIAKARLGVQVATGDLYVRPLWIGLAIGRVGCFLSGVTDGTHGAPSSLPWAMDLGDGIPRHPTALYEIGFLLVTGPIVGWIRWPRNGDAFKAWMAGYLGYRLVIEGIKTQPFPYAGLSGIQVACLGGLSVYAVAMWGRWREPMARSSAEPR